MYKDKQIQRRRLRQRKAKRKAKLVEKAFAAPWVEWRDVNRRSKRHMK